MILRNGSYGCYLVELLTCVCLVGLVDAVRCIVHPRQLDVPRRCDPLRARQAPTRHGTGAGARHIRRLDPGDLLSPWHARRQPDRQGPGSWGGWVR